ncbi:MAG TPA: hypothetical protein VEW93_08895 [Acidimicrobiales bacterium]|nr:hypothetical protein [Acidimicrobiales bacterium]
MEGERYVLLGLGTTRSPWFTEVARWATAGSLPAEFVKCMSVEELRVRLTSGRPFSSVLVDARSGAVDRDLLDVASRQRVSVLVVDGTGDDRWLALGATAVLPADMTRDQLVAALGDHSRLIGAATHLPVGDAPTAADTPTAAGPLVAVTGAGGAGTSTVAMALAQALAEPAAGRAVVLADLCLDADQAMLHDARDIVPGVQELVEAHRAGRPAPAEVRGLTFEVVSRGYDLLLGLRRHRDWAVLKPRSFAAALAGLRAAYDAVVADVDADLDGEAECGSVEVEERNVMARTTVAQADAVVAVGTPGVKGLHALVRTVDRLRDHGVDPERIVAVVNRSARAARGRAEMGRSFADLSGRGRAGPPVVGPVHLTERRGLDDLLRDGAPLPRGLAAPVAGAVAHVLVAVGPLPAPAGGPVPVAAGSLGRWAEQEAAG